MKAAVVSVPLLDWPPRRSDPLVCHARLVFRDQDNSAEFCAIRNNLPRLTQPITGSALKTVGDAGRSVGALNACMPWSTLGEEPG
jgi:hypothetical protein